MAFGASSGRRLRSEINVTPLVDVVLVLLIIFMVMAPILLRELDVSVPEKTDVEIGAAASDQAVLHIAADGTLSLNHEAIARDALAARVSALFGGRQDKVLFFEIDDEASYGISVEVMDACRGAGVRILGIMTQ